MSNEAESAEAKSDEVVTDRSKEREEEDQAFVPVIVKRSDESRRHPDDTLHQAVKDGLEQLYRRGWSLFLSSIAAGLILGFTALLVAVTAEAAAALNPPQWGRLLTALVYPIGYIICILSGTQLFTEHTATAVYPVLDGKAPLSRLLRLWLIVIVGNLLGTFVSAALLKAAETVVQGAAGYIQIGRHVVDVDTLPLLAGAVLAGWLMAQAAWLVTSSAHTSGQILAIYGVTFVIGVGGLHHSIAGTNEWLIASFVSEHGTWDRRPLHCLGSARQHDRRQHLCGDPQLRPYSRLAGRSGGIGAAARRPSCRRGGRGRTGWHKLCRPI